VKGLRSSIVDLQAKVEELTLKQEEVGARKVFDVEHLDLTGSTSTPQKELPQGGPTRPLGHDSAHDHRGSGHGVLVIVRDVPKKEFRKGENNSQFKYSGRLFRNANNPQVTANNTENVSSQSKKGNESGRGTTPEDKAATLMAYRKAKGLCYKCGMKWHPGHKCSNSVSLHVVEEL
jgi:hypothetical protein